MDFDEIVLAVILCAALVFMGVAAARGDRQDDLFAMKSQTVLIDNVGFLGGGRGSGVLLDETHVLTCAHMARGPKDDMLVFTYPMGRVYHAAIANRSERDDLMLLVLDSSAPVAKLPVFENHTIDGEAITVVGNALGSTSWYFSSGLISGREHGFLLTDALVKHGNSGGPWFNASGDIVAISDWGLVGEEGISGGVPADTIQADVQRWLHPTSTTDILQSILEGAQ